MLRENQTGSWGNGPQCRRRGSCQRIGYGFGRGFCRTPHELSTSDGSIAIETIETQAQRLEIQAANLRNLAKWIHKT